MVGAGLGQLGLQADQRLGLFVLAILLAQVGFLAEEVPLTLQFVRGSLVDPLPEVLAGPMAVGVLVQVGEAIDVVGVAGGGLADHCTATKVQ